MHGLSAARRCGMYRDPSLKCSLALTLIVHFDRVFFFETFDLLLSVLLHDVVRDLLQSWRIQGL